MSRLIDGYIPDVPSWPLLVAGLGGVDGGAVSQTVALGGFVQVLLDGPSEDSAGGWDTAGRRYVVQESGVYQLEATVRLRDGTAAGISYGLSIDGAPGGQFMQWATTNGQREGHGCRRKGRFVPGNVLLPVIYVSGGGTVDIAVATMEIERIR